MAKRLTMVRHSLRDSDKDRISLDGIHLARKYMPVKGYFTDLFYSNYFRTLQTLVAMMSVLSGRGRILTPQVHLPIREFGDDRTFDDMYTKEVEEFEETEEAEKLTSIDCLERFHPNKLIEEWKSHAAFGIKYALRLTSDNGHALAIGHEPIIPLAALAFDSERVCLKELDYIVFIQNDNEESIIEVEYIHCWPEEKTL